VTKGDVIFSIPLSSCLRDDDPPLWYDCAASSTTSAAAADESDTEDDGDGQPCLIAGSYNPSDWASRLAAKVLDARLFGADSAGGEGCQAEAAAAARRLWLDLLPDPDRLRPTLPVHWSPAVLRSACCTSLELAVDTAYFARARSVDGLAAALASALRSSGSPALRGAGPERIRRLCDDALDVVQTRSCRVAPNRFFPPLEAEAGSGRPDGEKLGDGEVGGGGDRAVCEAEWSPPLRVLAPVFDMINHSPRPNAEFYVVVAGEEPDEQERERLAVRALRDLEPGDQILIDYGVSARPAYRCLASYGFVPAAAAGPGSPEEEEDEDDDDDVAEVYIDGSRYEVTRSTVPEDIVLAVAPGPSSVGSAAGAGAGAGAAGAALTPDRAIRLASRLSDVAYQLLLNPLDHENFGDAPRGADGGDDEDEDEDDEDGGRGGTEESPSDVVSARLAASLRWSQHRILLACAMGLRDWAVGGGG
jgi:hypothetical protein